MVKRTQGHAKHVEHRAPGLCLMLSQLPPRFHAEHDARGYGISGTSLWPIGLICPGSVPSQPLLPPQLLAGRVRS